MITQNGRFGIRFPAVEKMFIFSIGSRKKQATTKSLIQWVMRPKGWGAETDHLPPSDAKMKNE
jgi:hypothetical protein